MSTYYDGSGENKEDMVERVSESDVEVIAPVASDYQTRRREIEEKKENIRRRIQKASSNQEKIKECFIPAKPVPTIDDGEKKRVAVYARVSTASEDQVSSIENQTLYYTKKIDETPNWELYQIYSDEGKSGTSLRHRDEFKRMLEDARLKKFDMIMCASVSRFARNVTDCLDQVSSLKTMHPSHPVGVFFETENIYTLNPDSGQALSLHALLADWESANKSRRMILSYDQRILTGQYPVADLLGYRHTKDGDLIIEEEEAKTVRFIFLSLLVGYDSGEIAEVLTEKERPTLRGRTEWNRSMVKNVMQNERRWGELDVRKVIVVDYKQGKTAKNNNDRCSAYVPDHHEAIVSPEIARAAKCIFKSSLTHTNGVSETRVIEEGGLKGFVSVNPTWGGVDNDMFHILCRSVYDEEELSNIHRQMNIVEGKEHSNITYLGIHGYQVPYGIGYLTVSMPSLTISNKNIQFNKACHKRFGDCEFIEIYYHPIMQALIIREVMEETENAIRWGKDDGSIIGTIPSKAFSEAVYENMCWRKDYKFRFRGITKVRNGFKIMFFFLDEPQILLGKKQKEELAMRGFEAEGETAYIPYKEVKENEQTKLVMFDKYGYPEEWNRSIGMSYELRTRRENQISSITAEDIRKKGSVVENPLIGHIPSREEILEELDGLLMSM